MSADRSIVALFFRCRPSAIARLVVAVVVDAIKRAALRTWAHVGQEVGEVIPSLTDGNPSSAVSRKILNVRERCTNPHREPASVFTGFFSGPCVTVLGNDVLVQTVAASGIPTHQANYCHERFAATLTTTFPNKAQRFSGAPFGGFYHGQSAKHLARQVFVMGPASTTDYPAMNQMIVASEMFVATCAGTSPHRFLVLPRLACSDNRQSAKDTSGQIDRRSAYGRSSHASSSMQGMRVVRGWRPFARLSASLSIVDARA